MDSHRDSPSHGQCDPSEESSLCVATGHLVTHAAASPTTQHMERVPPQQELSRDGPTGVPTSARHAQAILPRATLRPIPPRVTPPNGSGSVLGLEVLGLRSAHHCTASILSPGFGFSGLRH